MEEEWNRKDKKDGRMKSRRERVNELKKEDLEESDGRRIKQER